MSMVQAVFPRRPFSHIAPLSGVQNALVSFWDDLDVLKRGTRAISARLFALFALFASATHLGPRHS